MPFLGKKVKSGRISQLVNDHLHNSQKRRDGSSLVVETGFPTSLIDLFIKNREKLKSPSKKKRRNPPISDSDDQLIEKSSTPFPPPPSIGKSLTPVHSPLRCPSPLHNLSVCAGEISAVGSSGCVDDERAVGDVNKVLFGVLKIFLVVVLALGTKRLAVGITISAFLLLFIEYVVRHVSVTRVVRCVSNGKKNDGVLMTKSLEIQEIESKCEEDIQEIEVMEDEPCLDHQECEVIERDGLVLESESKKKSRKSKIKSKMKKYVTKKFTRSRKQNDPQKPEEQPPQVDQSENGSVSSSSSSSNSRRMYGDEDGTSEICPRVAQLTEVLEETNTNKDEEIKGDEVVVEGGLTWRHLVLCLIVLIGLLGGRVFALVLTLSWFLILKLGQKLPRFMKK